MKLFLDDGSERFRDASETYPVPGVDRIVRVVEAAGTPAPAAPAR